MYRGHTQGLMGSVSVIIPTLNAAGLIRPLVEKLRAQKADVLEIIVIDSSSKDSTVATANSLGCEVIVIPAEEFNHGLTRNLAAGVARGEVLVFMTQDAVPSDDMLITNLLTPLEDAAVAASYARQVCGEGANPLERFCRQFNYPPTEGGRVQLKDYGALAHMGIKTFFFSNVCSAIKRDVFLEMGGFVETLMNEDMVFAAALIRSGYKVAYQPQAVVIHCHNYSVIEQLRRHFDIGVSLRDNALLEYARPHGEGKRFVKAGARHLFKEEGLYYLGYFFLDTLFRYAGYSLGTRHMLLPGRLKRWLTVKKEVKKEPPARGPVPLTP
ncbi:MAG: glycosyltransferase family 2 protein [Nitrospirae bacterium]|nr:glycosyltransferase family 2 protein [Nitrospirota bacterium]